MKRCLNLSSDTCLYVQHAQITSNNIREKTVMSFILLFTLLTTSSSLLLTLLSVWNPCVALELTVFHASSVLKSYYHQHQHHHHHHTSYLDYSHFVSVINTKYFSDYSCYYYCSGSCKSQTHYTFHIWSAFTLDDSNT